MCRLFLLLCLYGCSINVFACHNSDAASDYYTDCAQYFIQQHIIHDDNAMQISCADLQYLMNLIYFSYKRSHCSMLAHQNALQLLEQSWQLYQNIRHTMRDPWHQLPYPSVSPDISQVASVYHDHFAIGDQYSHAVFEVSMTSEYTQQVIRYMRDYARDIRVTFILYHQHELMQDIKQATEAHQHATELLQCCQTALQDHLGIFSDENVQSDEILTYSILQDHEYVINLYITADNAGMNLSYEQWQAYMSSEQFQQKVWCLIEHARVSWYKALYKLLYPLLQQEDQQYRTILFDRNGVIARENRNELLPTIT